jgi:hypothetical protein
VAEDERGRRSEAARKAAATKGAEAMREVAREAAAKRSPEERREAALRAAATRRRNREAGADKGGAAGS